MKYELFLSDFDGTLVKDGGTVCKKNRDAIKTYQERGGIFVVVTGRMLKSILQRLRELGLQKGLVSACQGAVIADIETKTPLFDFGFSSEETVRALKTLETLDLHLHAYTNEEFYCNREDEFLKMYESLCGVRAKIEPNLSEFAAREKIKSGKILIMCEPQRRESLRREIEALLPEFKMTSSSPYLLELLPKGIDKGSCAKFLSNYFHIPKEKTASIGDEENDLPMLLSTGGRFSVANASEILKRCSRVVASAEEGGVSEALLLSMEEEDEKD